MQRNKAIIIVFVLLTILSVSLLIKNPKYTPYTPGESTVEQGDLIRINYILSTVDEVVLDTSYPAVAQNWGLEPNHSLEPVAVRIGEGDIIEGVEEALVSMRKGEQKEVTVAPDKGYGIRDPELVRTFQRVLRYPLMDTIDVESFRLLSGSEPIAGNEYTLGYWNVTVLELNEGNVTFRNNAVNTTLENLGGRPLISVDDKGITLTFQVAVNDTFRTSQGFGRVMHVDEQSFIVDLNHPLAGQTLVFFLRVEEIIKHGQPQQGKVKLGDVTFLTSYEVGRKLSLETGKPIFLYFHAPWCRWCKKFEAEVLTYKRVVSKLEEGYIAVSVDVDISRGVASDFNIFGTPTILLIDKNGSEILRVRGYRAPDEIDELL